MVLTKCDFPGSLERNLTDLPPCSMSTGVYVGIHISQEKIHYVPFVLALRRNRIRESDVVPFHYLFCCKNWFFGCLSVSSFDCITTFAELSIEAEKIKISCRGSKLC